LYQGSKFDEFLTKKLVISAKSFGAFQYALKFESSILELQKFINHNAKAMAKNKYRSYLKHANSSSIKRY
jgi:hypothetical protein